MGFVMCSTTTHLCLPLPCPPFSCASLQGAVADLSTVLTLQPNNTKGQEELAALKSRAQAVAAAAAAQAEYQRHTSRTVADSCTIEEVEDDPEEEQMVRKTHFFTYCSLFRYQFVFYLFLF